MEDKVTLFNNPTKGVLTLDQVVTELKEFMEDNPDSNYRLVIGTDSKVKGSSSLQDVDFITAVVIHRIGSYGRYFWHKKRVGKKMVLRDRIYTETFLSIEVALALVPKVQKETLPGIFELEIHIDVGPSGPTREMIKEVVGIVTGNGFTAKTKPESFGAFVVADRHT